MLSSVEKRDGGGGGGGDAYSGGSGCAVCFVHSAFSQLFKYCLVDGGVCLISLKSNEGIETQRKFLQWHQNTTSEHDRTPTNT